MINASDTSTQQSPLRERPPLMEGAAADEPRRRPWHLHLLAMVALVLVVLAIVEIGPPTSSARTSTQIVTAEQGVVQSTVTGSGNIEAGTNVNANFQASGTLSNVYVHVGQHVNKGQVLATLNPSAAQLTLDQAEQNLIAAQDQLSSAESGSSTSAGSTPGTSSGSSATSSSSTTTSSAASIASAQAAVDAALASVDNAQTALNETKLYAPVGGTIASLASLVPGDTVSAGSTGSASASGTPTGTTASSGSSAGGSAGTVTGSLGGSSTSSSSTTSSSSASSPFAEIVNTGTMTMTVAFSESDVNKLKVGQAVTVAPDALSGVELGAHVTAISPVGTTSSSVVSYTATLTLDQSDSRVKPGMSASAAVIVGQAQGVNVPSAAVSGSGSLATVEVLRNGKQTQQQVVVGLRGDSRTQIIGGLRASEQVVIKTTLPPLSSATTTTSGATGTLGATGARPGGFGGAGGAGFGGGGAGGRAATTGSGG